MTMLEIATNRDALKAAINNIIDQTSVDDLLSMLQEIANERAETLSSNGDAAAAVKWLLLNRAINRAILAAHAGGL